MSIVQKADYGIVRRLKRSMSCVELVKRCGIELRRDGSNNKALCPFHKESCPSFDVTDIGFNCFGCGAHGDHIQFLKLFYKTDFRGALNRLSAIVGGNCISAGSAPLMDEKSALEREMTRAKRIERARSLWQEALPAAGTIVETYIRGRGIEMPVPSSIRFHPRLWEPETSQLLPGMLTVIQGHDATINGVHRTYLKPDGSGKYDGCANAKKMLGEAMGSVARLSGIRQPLAIAIGEGLETCLSVAEAHPGLAVWCCLTLPHLLGFELPEYVYEVTILADNDSSNDEQDRINAKIGELAQAWRSKARRRVNITYPPRGMDYNDLWKQKQRDLLPGMLSESGCLPRSVVRARIGLI